MIVCYDTSYSGDLGWCVCVCVYVFLSTCVCIHTIRTKCPTCPVKNVEKIGMFFHSSAVFTLG